ncbi:hypothetical protein HHK36_002252 [Tetracentron sinense]|uniref:DUF7722 domain-containing protein n=1 Tax=Tetracentron sinense TaxID=13715 RepID=A0A834ZXV3_TETSI|nr:hypothetical protein HHK36_002252 [Tetracentron sinense]
MALRWLLHSACTQILGYPKDINKQCSQIVAYPTEGHVQGSVKSLKDPNEGLTQGETCINKYSTGFQMPLHYPRYKKANYETMEEWKVDMVLREYGLSFKGTLDEKREFAIGAFLNSGLIGSSLVNTDIHEEFFKKSGDGLQSISKLSETKEVVVKNTTESVENVVAEEKERQGGENNGFLITEENELLIEEDEVQEKEEGNGLLSTEELNKNFDDFIKRMKEGIRNEAPLH